MSVLSRLQPKIHEATGCYANWIPAAPVKVGDFGIVAADRFLQEGNIEEFEIAYQVQSGKPLKATQEYSSGVLVSIGGKARAEGEIIPVDPKINSSISLKFGHKGAFVYHVSGITIHKLAHTRQIYEELLAGIQAGRLGWKRRSVIVSEVWDTDRATIIISERGQAGMDLSGKIGGAGPGFLARAGASVALTRSSGNMWKWLSTEQCAPFIGLIHPVIDPDDGGIGQRRSLADFLLRRPKAWDISDITPVDYVEGDAPKMIVALPDGRSAALRFEALTLSEFMSWSSDYDTIAPRLFARGKELLSTYDVSERFADRSAEAT